jgi:hypothetical protein
MCRSARMRTARLELHARSARMRTARLELHARSARMRTARHKAPCRFVYNAATAAEMHAPCGRGPSAWGHPLRWGTLDVKKTSEIFSEVF